MRKIFTTVKQFVALLLFMRAIAACSSEDMYTGGGASIPVTKAGSEAVSEFYTDSTKNGTILLSDAPAANPYNVDTLKKAYAKLYPKGRASMPNFNPTHYQVRFLPVDTLEFEALKNSDLIVTPIPLDKKVVGEGASYFDPALKAQGVPFTWQYTIVPVSQPLPNIRHEITAQICAPNDGTLRSVNDVSIWPALEEKAFEMCGEEAPSFAMGRSGMPGVTGNDYLKRVLVWDDIAQTYIPAKGAKLVFWTNSGVQDVLVDASGNYTYSGGAYTRLELHWDSIDKWVIYDDNESSEAIYALPQLSNGVWTIRIKGGKQQAFAHLTRALYRFYDEYNHGLDVPPMGSGERLDVVCADSHDPGKSGYYSKPRKTVVFARTSTGAYRAGFGIFNTMVHELGHSIHYRNIILDKRRWDNTGEIIKESWASFVEWLLMEYEYNELGRIINSSKPLTFTYQDPLPYWLPSGAPGLPGQPSTKVYNRYTYAYQGWPFRGTEPGAETVNKPQLKYSPIMIDLADDDNQQNYWRSYGMQEKWSPNSYTYYPNDQVSGYSVGQIMGALRYSESLSELAEHIINSRPHTEAERAKIDVLFNSYINYWNGYQ